MFGKPFAEIPEIIYLDISVIYLNLSAMYLNTDIVW